MNTTKILTISSVLGIATIFAVIFGMFISFNNREKSLRNLGTAQIEVSKNTFETTWKTIKQQAQVTEKYKDSFREVYTSIMDERYEGDRAGALMSWVQEANPQFDSSIFTKLMTTIEANRLRFQGSQDKLADIKREHDNLLDLFPSSLFLSGRARLEMPYVRSTLTNEVFSTGIDDSLGVF